VRWGGVGIVTHSSIDQPNPITMPTRSRAHAAIDGAWGVRRVGVHACMLRERMRMDEDGRGWTRMDEESRERKMPLLPHQSHHPHHLHHLHRQTDGLLVGRSVGWLAGWLVGAFIVSYTRALPSKWADGAGCVGWTVARSHLADGQRGGPSGIEGEAGWGCGCGRAFAISTSPS